MNGISQTEATIIQSLGIIERRILELGERIEGLQANLTDLGCTKDWYSTKEVADLMGVTRQTVQDRWCNQGRIECQKDPKTGKWRIPGHEYERLRRGGRPD